MSALDDELFRFLNKHQRVGRKSPPVFGAKGLSPSELDRLEEQLGFEFPKDFRFLFENVNDPDAVLFPWARFSIDDYNEAIDRVWSSVAFDIEKNNIWLTRWGSKPADMEDAIAIARRDFDTWPKLLPIYGHRFLPAEPCLDNNPVFSIVQTDIIYYGANLADYLLREFCSPDTWLEVDLARRIPIWSDFAESTPGFSAN